VRDIRLILSEEHLVVFVRSFLGLVLLTAGGAKLTNGKRFVEAVSNFRILPPSMSRLIGHALPPLEIVLAIGLLVGALTPWLELTATVLFILFGGAVTVNLLRGRRDISCGCFGAGESRHLTWALVARNGLLGMLAAMLIYASSSGIVGERLAIADRVTTILASAAALASILLWNTVRSLWRLPVTSSLSGARSNTGKASRAPVKLAKR
jgi:hypothetical protein